MVHWLCPALLLSLKVTSSREQFVLYLNKAELFLKTKWDCKKTILERPHSRLSEHVRVCVWVCGSVCVWVCVSVCVWVCVSVVPVKPSIQLQC